jgi:hypothetical protein
MKRIILNKVCKGCSESLPETEFYVKDKSTGRRDGLCKTCRYKKNEIYRHNNRAKTNRQRLNWYYQNSEKVNSRRRSRRLEDPEYRQRQMEQQAAASARHRQKNIDAFLASGRPMPECECGCGQLVNFNEKGKPNRCVLGHSGNDGPFISIEKFRSVLADLRNQKGWSVPELAEHGGLSAQQLRLILYSHTRYKRGINKEFATNFLRRCAGLPAPATPYQLKKRAELAKREEQLETSYGIT